MLYLQVTRQNKPSVTVLCRRNIIPGTHVHSFKDKADLDKFLNDTVVKEHIKLGFLSLEPLTIPPKDVKIIEEERSIGANVDNNEKPSERKLKKEKSEK